MKKQTIRMITALFLLLAVVLTGCAQNRVPTEQTPDPVLQETQNGGGETSNPAAKHLLPVKQKKKPVIVRSTLSCDPKNDAAYVNLTQEEFESYGFSLGDSCDVLFSNHYFLSEVPYYNGFYVKNGLPVIVAYPGADRVAITFNNRGIWTELGLQEGDAVIFRLNQKGEFLDLQETLGQVYSNDRQDYTSDVQFCNFRALQGGKLKSDWFYRGASPVDNCRGRASYTDSLISDQQIAFIVDLADSEEDVLSYMQYEDFNSPYALDLYKRGQMVMLDMNTAYESEEYHKKVATGLREMLKAEGPIYIHCTEGKDRTGFVCMLLEALAGATYGEMKKDYMITYENYYQVSEEMTEDKYTAIGDLYFDAFVSYLHGTEDKTELENADYTQDAWDYLKNGGMTDKELQQLQRFLTGRP